MGEFSDKTVAEISASCPQSLSLYLPPSLHHLHQFWSWDPGRPLPTWPLGDQCVLSDESGKNICFVPFSFYRILDGMRGILRHWRSSIQSAKTRPGHDCGLVHKLLITQFRLKMKKGGKTTRPFKYNLNQISYSYIVEVTNRFKGLDLIACLKNYGRRFITLYRRQGSRPSPKKRNTKRHNVCLRRTYK